MNFIDVLFTIGILISTIAGTFLLLTITGRESARIKTHKRYDTSRLEKQLPGFLDRISSEVLAGRSLQQSLRSVAGEKDNPFRKIVGDVFDLVVANRDLSDALETVAVTTGSYPLRLALVSMALSNRSGCNIVEALGVLAQLCGAREMVRQKTLAQSAQARMQGVVLILVPILFMVALAVVSPHSLAIVIGSGTGRAILAAAVLFHLCGSLVIARMVRPERW